MPPGQQIRGGAATERVVAIRRDHDLNGLKRVLARTCSRISEAHRPLKPTAGVDDGACQSRRTAPGPPINVSALSPRSKAAGKRRGRATNRGGQGHFPVGALSLRNRTPTTAATDTASPLPGAAAGRNIYRTGRVGGTATDSCLTPSQDEPISAIFNPSCHMERRASPALLHRTRPEPTAVVDPLQMAGAAATTSRGSRLEGGTVPPEPRGTKHKTAGPTGRPGAPHPPAPHQRTRLCCIRSRVVLLAIGFLRNPG